MPDFFNKLGLFRNQLMLLGVFSGSSMFWGGARLSGIPDHELKITGIALFAAGVIMFFLTMLFYCFALIFLPTSRLELMFYDQVRKDLAEHRKKLRKTKSDKQAATARAGASEPS